MTDAISAPTSAVNQTDYLKLFMQELTYQDPLKPVDNREFMAQMAQFSALQETKATNDALAALIHIESHQQSLLMLGKSVMTKHSDEPGKVSKIQYAEGLEPTFTIIRDGGSETVALSDITSIW